MRIKLLILTFACLLFGVSPVLASDIRINEFSSDDKPEWVELYNAGTETVSLNNWVLWFDDDTPSQTITFSSNESIAPGGYKVVEHNYAGQSGWLNNNSDTIIIKDSSDIPQDSISYGGQSAIVEDPAPKQSAGRNPNGTGEWIIFSSPTMGTPNIAYFPSTPPSPSPTPTPTSSPTPTPSPTPSNSPKPKATNTPSKTPAPTANPTIQPTVQPSVQDITATPKPVKSKPKLNYQIASVAAITTSATPAAQVSVKSQKQTNYLIWVGIILIFAGILSIGYIYLRKNADIHIKLRKRD